MKTIGLIGGVSWQASAEYYRIINREVQTRLGPAHSAKLVMVSLDFEPVARSEHERNWTGLATMLIDSVKMLERAGSELVLIASNTLHRVASEIQQAINIPLVHIAEVTAEAMLAANISMVGLLGTNFVMEEGFYTDVLASRGIQAIVPPKAQRDYVHNVIYNELCAGQISNDSRHEVIKIIEDLKISGCYAVVLANTELPFLLCDADISLPLFDSLEIHAQAAVAFAMA